MPCRCTETIARWEVDSFRCDGDSASVFRSVASAWSFERDSAKGESPESEKALLEEAYREQFPDHGEEYRSLLHTIDVGEDLDMPAEVEQNEGCEPDWQVTEDQIAILCSLHKDLFSRHVKSMDEKSRTRALCASYSAAYHLAQMRPMVSTDSSDDFEQVGSHIVALSLCSGSSHGIHPDHSDASDFHRDANPKEVAKASRPLEMLIARTSQLLSAFPGHSVLVALVRVADHVRKLPLSTTSVGKAMRGLEIILRRAQEWEQHASSLVKLGTPLQDVSKLVTCWRKLELQSWGTLLDARGLCIAKRARWHWPRLYTVLIRGVEQKGTPSSSPRSRNDWAVEAPKWVWKGLRADTGTSRDSSSYHVMDGTIFNLSQVMDTFLLSSSLGEFKERLDLVETFATQISLMNSQSAHVEPSQSKVARMLFSLMSFYRQFTPMLDSRLGELRRPIEARLRDEVKLAKWDEQSYYALRDSTEKNHRKLMKLLREYDDVLELTVSSVLEKHLCHGVRSMESCTEEPCSSIPPYKVLFPFVHQMKGTGGAVGPSGSLSLVAECQIWADPEKAGLVCDKYVSRMGHYAKRMATLLQSNGPTWSRVGSDGVSTLCEMIFERIESLRMDKTTKTMKQRALIDLFKALKKNGFLHTKWSVPEQVREMAHLLLLPGLIVSGKVITAEESKDLEGAEKYFQRTTAEVNRLRSEVLMLGSKHMSQRETQIMMSLAEHGLTMLCQQRCVLATLLKQLSRLEELTGSCDAWYGLPVGQTKLRKTLEAFNDAVLSVSENLKQLQTLIKVTLPLIEEADKTEAMRDTDFSG